MRGRDDLAHLQRGAARGVDLVAVVRLDDLDIEADVEGARSLREQLHDDVDADAHVRREDDGQVLRDGADLVLLGVGEAGGAHDGGRHSGGATGGQVMQRALGPGEVDEHLRAGQARGEIGRDGHAAAAAEEGRGVLAQVRAAFDIEGAGEGAVGGIEDGLDQHVPHAPGGAGDRDAQRRRVVCAQFDSSGG